MFQTPGSRQTQDMKTKWEQTLRNAFYMRALPWDIPKNPTVPWWKIAENRAMIAIAYFYAYDYE